MLSVNWSDVVNILNTLKPYLIALAVIVVVALVAVIAVMKVSKTRRKIIRSEVGLAALLAITIVAKQISDRDTLKNTIKFAQTSCC